MKKKLILFSIFLLSFISVFSQDMSKEDLELNITYASQELKKNPNDILQLKVRGTSYFHLEDYKKALIDYHKVTSLEKDKAVFYNMGLCYSRLGNNDMAIKYYSFAVKIDETYFDAIINRGVIYEEEKQYGKALLDFERGKELKGEVFQVCLNLGSVYLEMDKLEKSEMYLKKALKIKENNSYVNFYLAKLFMQKKDKKQACLYYKKTSSLPKNYEISEFKKLLDYCK